MKAIRIVESQEKAPYNTNVENKSCIFNFNLVKCGGTVRIMIMSLGNKGNPVGWWIDGPYDRLSLLQLIYLDLWEDSATMPYSLADHETAVHRVAEDVAHFHENSTPFRINHGSTNSTRARDSKATPQLNISHLKNIITIDRDTQSAWVEPNVALDALLVRTLKVGLMPPVVMEFPGITVGGGFSGASGESTSWKEGLFDCCILEVEMILGNGKIVRARKDGEDSELFNAARCSLGTMGVVTLLQVRLVKAPGAVLMTYTHTSSAKETIDQLDGLCKGRSNHQRRGS